MIQRIQSLYLLITALLTGSLFFTPMGYISGEQGIYALKFMGLTDITNPEQPNIVFSTWPLTVLIVLTTVMSLLAIFLFKNRLLQIRVCGINIGLLAGLSGLILYTAHTMASNIEGTLTYSIPMFLPLLGIILTILAIRAIGRDEALIRSVDRLR